MLHAHHSLLVHSARLRTDLRLMMARVRLVVDVAQQILHLECRVRLLPRAYLLVHLKTMLRFVHGRRSCSRTATHQALHQVAAPHQVVASHVGDLALCCARMVLHLQLARVLLVLLVVEASLAGRLVEVVLLRRPTTQARRTLLRMRLGEVLRGLRVASDEGVLLLLLLCNKGVTIIIYIILERVAIHCKHVRSLHEPPRLRMAASAFAVTLPSAILTLVQRLKIHLLVGLVAC